MRLRRTGHARLALLALATALGVGSGLGAVELAAAVGADDGPAGASVLDATHLPPLLTLPSEPARLSYDVHCAPAGGDPETGCRIVGTVHVRARGDTAWRTLELVPDGSAAERHGVTVPASIATSGRGYEYYAVVTSEAGSVLLPPGGADAPHVSRPLGQPVEVDLGRHPFGAMRRTGERAAYAPWGSGPGQVGLEPGRTLGPIGATSFDVDASGAITVLDPANRRLHRWRRGAPKPVSVPVSVTGAIADMVLAGDGSLYVLETTAPPGRRPSVRRFDDGGRELEAVETPDRGTSQIRMTPDGPAILGQPSHHWMPVAVEGTPATRSQQVRRGRLGRRFAGGREVVVLRTGNELRLALLAGSRTIRSWRVTSSTPLAEVQLAEPLGERLLVVLRVYRDADAEFAVLVLDRHGLASRFAIEPADWAETAPFGRIRHAARAVYRLGSSPAGAFVDRFDLEVTP